VKEKLIQVNTTHGELFFRKEGRESEENHLQESVLELECLLEKLEPHYLQ
jgi:hypothetical protein